MNRITHRQPSQLGWSDSCTSGLRGFSLNGTAWRLRIPKSSPIFGIAKVNNVLEFLALAIRLWTILIECEKGGHPGECVLVLGDSTSALGWLFRMGHIQKDSFYHAPVNLIARNVARLVINSSHCLASQHSSLPQLIPHNFVISPLPDEILSFAILVPAPSLLPPFIG
jgi:hypothetical protein